MQHIEDALEWLAARLASAASAAPGVSGLTPGDAWSDGFVQGIAARARGGCALTEGQAEAARRLVAQNARVLVESGAVSEAALDRMLHPARFRNGSGPGAPVRREVRLLSPDLLAFRFAFAGSEVLRHDIRVLGRAGQAATPTRDRATGLWLAPLLARSVPAIRAVIARHRFAADAAVRARLRFLAARAGKASRATLAPDGTVRLDAHDNELLACWCAQAAGAWRPR